MTGLEGTTTVTICRVFAAAAALCSVGMASAGPAQAHQVLEGVYTYTQDGLPPLTWTIYPSCMPVVGDLREPLYLPVGCRLHIQSSTGATGGDARLTGGAWSYTTSIPEGMQCPDGSWARITETYTFDDATLTGTRSAFHNAGDCGLPAGSSEVPFTLAFSEALPMPVERYPLICEPGGLRRCS